MELEYRFYNPDDEEVLTYDDFMAYAEDTITEQLEAGQYDDLLDELYDDFIIGNMSYNASHVLYRVDPTAYRIGLTEEASHMIEQLEYDISQAKTGDEFYGHIFYETAAELADD